MLKEIPPRSKFTAIAFPSREAEKDGGYKMGEAAPVPFNLSASVRSLKLAGKVLAGVKDPLAPIRRSPRLQRFAESSGFGATQRRATQARLFWLLVRNAVNIQSAFRPSQGMATMMGAFDTWDLAHAQAQYAAKAKQKYIEQGLILADGGDLGAGGTFENGHLGYLEGIILYDPSNPASVEAVRDLVEGGLRASIDQALGVPIAAFGVKANEELGPHCYHYDRWVSRLKTALDPHTASDPFFYAEADDEE